MIIDFLAFAPSYLSFIFPVDLRVLRIFRLFRLVKLARYSQALPALLGVLYAERSALFASMVLLISTVFVTGEVMHIAEGAVQPKLLGTLPDAMYWAITTLTTVGYGDITPQTPLGKLIAGVTMILGLALFALPIGIIANGFVSGLNRRRFAVTWTILKHQPLFEGFDVEALSDILESVTANVIREHGQLIVAGESANAMFLIVSGIAREDREDAEKILEHGDIVGAQALKHQSTYTRTVTARTEMRIMALPHEDLRRLARKYPLLRRRVEAAIALEEQQVCRRSQLRSGASKSWKSRTPNCARRSRNSCWERSCSNVRQTTPRRFDPARFVATLSPVSSALSGRRAKVPDPVCADISFS